MPFDTRRRLLLLVLLTTLLTPAVATAADLTVVIDGLRSNAGDVHVAVYDDPDAFPDRTGMLLETEAPIEDGRATATFAGLPAGLYAIAVYHDEDSDDTFDQFVFGLPLEGYGFSNDAAVFFGPPAFADAAVALGDEPLTAIIEIRY